MPFNFPRSASWNKTFGGASATNASQASNPSAGPLSFGVSDTRKIGVPAAVVNFEELDTASDLLPGESLLTAYIDQMTVLSAGIREHLGWKEKAGLEEMASEKSKKLLTAIDASVSSLEREVHQLQSAEGFESELPENQTLAEELATLQQAHRDWKAAGL